MSGALSGHVRQYLVAGLMYTPSHTWTWAKIHYLLGFPFSPPSVQRYVQRYTTRRGWLQMRCTCNTCYSKKLMFRITRYMLSIESDSEGSTMAANATNMLARLTVGVFACLTRQQPNPEYHQVTRAHSKNTRDSTRCDKLRTRFR
ncbi:unnamed protein product [Fusarium venenatum]|uniref:Uncharacterized protein n=1 Tax=Fusarium venenatum TaxID=56646 RepID=A0A2L2T2C8_9HYPO|nr:uncharacterized protein FVRRES_11980 [Fusarium venenatum]CEI39289.1 unnamed protein product [Fusarium venenatum]